MRRSALKALVLFCILWGCSNIESHDSPENVSMNDQMKGFERATFAGGCFWCMEPPFEKIDAVVEVISGYTGGHEENPTYKEVSSGNTGHVEAVQIIYDPNKISYEELLDVFWRQIDPTDAGGSFVDRGSQYKSAIFYHNEEQRRLAGISKEKLNKLKIYDKPVATEIHKLNVFYRAEEYHQDYYKKNSLKYKLYRYGSGRDQFLKKVWDNNVKKKNDFQKPSDEALKKRLSPIQYKVTQQNGTERPFDNKYWDYKEDGIYVDIVSGEPLFSSRDKYDSNTGWPSFIKPLEPENIIEIDDRSFFMVRTEVRSSHADSHLGHVFKDGPKPTGMRYCINSAALKFVPIERLETEGYGKYKERFSAQ